jgi:hypothetical protein
VQNGKCVMLPHAWTSATYGREQVVVGREVGIGVDVLQKRSLAKSMKVTLFHNERLHHSWPSLYSWICVLGQAADVMESVVVEEGKRQAAPGGITDTRSYLEPGFDRHQLQAKSCQQELT